MAPDHPHIIKLATRASPLALWQARRVATLIQQAAPDFTVELLPLTTRPDRLPNTPLATLGGDKGLFVKEIEQAVIDRRAHAAVHSLKDVPVESQPPGLTLVAFPERANPADVLVSPQHNTLHDLPAGAIIATSALRRQAQLLHLRPDLNVTGIRGNVQTRLQKLQAGECQAVIMAAAGLERLNLQEKITQIFSLDQFLPAPGQGILAVQAPEDSPFASIWQSIDNPAVRLQAQCERLFSQKIGATCRSAAACYLDYISSNETHLTAAVFSRDGKTRLIARRTSDSTSALQAVASAASELLAAGCKSLL